MIDLSPLDHNAECRYCDEQGYHAADCPWLLGVVAKVHTAEEALAPLIAQVEALQDRCVALAGQATDAQAELAAREQIIEIYEAQLAGREQVITNQLRNLGELRREVTEVTLHREELQEDKKALELLVKELIAAAKHGAPAGSGDRDAQ